MKQPIVCPATIAVGAGDKLTVYTFAVTELSVPFGIPDQSCACGKEPVVKFDAVIVQLAPNVQGCVFTVVVQLVIQLEVIQNVFKANILPNGSNKVPKSAEPELAGRSVVFIATDAKLLSAVFAPLAPLPEISACQFVALAGSI